MGSHCSDRDPWCTIRAVHLEDEYGSKSLGRRRALFMLALGTASPIAAPVRLARHPDYHGGKVVFSYLGDIWMANEDGSNVHRLTDNLAREVYPRFSPDGRSIAFSSNRYGNNDVYVIAATGGTPRRLTYHTGATTSSAGRAIPQQVIFRAARGDGAFPASPRSIRSRRRAGRNSR